MSQSLLVLICLVFASLHVSAEYNPMGHPKNKLICSYPVGDEARKYLSATASTEKDCISSLLKQTFALYKNAIKVNGVAQNLFINDISFGWDYSWNYQLFDAGYAYEFIALNNELKVFRGFLVARIFSQDDGFQCYTVEQKTSVESTIAQIYDSDKNIIWSRNGAMGCGLRQRRWD